MNTLPSPVALVPNRSYETTRFNALRHGTLSRHTVLPWEDRSEYQSLLGALVAEHMPDGPTEEHLVEELAGDIGESTVADGRGGRVLGETPSRRDRLSDPRAPGRRTARARPSEIFARESAGELRYGPSEG